MVRVNNMWYDMKIYDSISIVTIRIHLYTGRTCHLCRRLCLENIIQLTPVPMDTTLTFLFFLVTVEGSKLYTLPYIGHTYELQACMEC